MRPSILKTPARELRQDYIQQYLKHFLRRVHPDLFQKYPKEQLRNSASLQDLLPLVNYEKQGLTDSKPASLESHALGSKSAQLVFYYKPDKATTELKQVEHALPLPIDTRIPINLQDASNHKVLEQEVKSWEMVQSFLELCRKVGVPVKEPDQKDISIQLEQSIQEVMAKQPQQRTPQKPLGEIFAEELQGSFSGSLGSVSSPSPPLGSVVDDVDTGAIDISSTHLGKIGGSAPALDARVMIRSNPLLFQSPELSKSKMGRVIRTWIHWQEEDEQSTVAQERFQLSGWWRKVPLMIMTSAEERTSVLKASEAKSARGMLIVDADMSKHDMIEYLRNNLCRVQSEYKDMLQQVGQAVPPCRHSSTESSDLSDEAASYLARMKARSSPRRPR
ncbi:hypothetical protein BG006_003901 [Podila minutissima]|uniref:DUF4460 domain-containing protein n=1 Tax=Podila minutissima TaxID=64525 RepID=A0A9P5SMS5_9FUNG|nr:hypothetical protein BG006_003901 [Podila minutissima]